MKIHYLILSALSLLLASCGGWTDKDKTRFIEACEAKMDRTYCDCALEKAVNEFSTFEDFTEDQEAMVNILTSDDCLGLNEE